MQESHKSRTDMVEDVEVGINVCITSLLLILLSNN